MAKLSERKSISDKLILSLYGSGWSINDIIKHYKTSVRRVRRVLHVKGIDTASYRSVCPNFKECILALVAAGLPIRRISDTIDMSTHLIRQVMRDNKVNAYVLRKDYSQTERPLLLDFSWEEFIKVYLDGKLGFIKCMELQGFTVEQCVAVVSRLSDDQIKKHSEGIRLEIAKHCDSGLSAVAIAKKVGVSASMVRSIYVQSVNV